MCLCLGSPARNSGPHFQQLVRGGPLLQVPRKPLQLFGSQGILCNQQEVGAIRTAQPSPSFGTVLHPWDHIQESLRPKSPSFVPDVRTGGLYWGGKGVSVFRQADWGILTWGHPCLNPTALPEEVLGSPGPRTTAKLPALSKCSSPISSHTHTNEQSKPRCLNIPSATYHTVCWREELGLETFGNGNSTYCKGHILC